MVTRRTRLMSAVVAVLMLISMLTAFVLPVSADPTTGGIVAEKGLYDATALPNIKEGIQADKNAYQVNDYDGMLKMSNLVNGGTSSFSTITVYQTADIDMGWQMFPGIGYGENSDKPFKGTFDGNGFTIDNLYVTRTGEAADAWYKGYGLFGSAEGATLKNIGISGGLIVGTGWVGSIVGRGVGNKIYNCWNAATVIGNTNAGTGGIAGTSINGSALVNCYNVGAVINLTSKSCGLVGWASNANDYIANSYNAGQIVSGTAVDDAQMHKYAEILICEFDKGYSANSENNYYVKGRSAMISSVAEYLEDHDGIGNTVAPGTTTVLKGTDGAHGVAVAGLTDGTLANGLNSNPIKEAIVGDYTVTYENVDGVGYPVLTYRNAEKEIVAQRYAKDNTNVNGDKTLENASPLFAQMVANNGKNFKVSGAITIETSDDLFFVSNLLYANVPTIIAAENKITLAADVDMNARATFPGIKHFIPFGLHKAPFTGTFDGARHTIANWGFVATCYSGKSTDGGLISVGYGSYVVKNLGLINACGRFENGTGGTAYPGLLVCKNGLSVAKDATITNCFVTGTMEMASIANKNNDGAVFGTTWGKYPFISNCWADVKINGAKALNTTARVIGKIPNNDALANMSTNIINSSAVASAVGDSNVALQAEQRIGKAAGTKEHAWYLNNLSGWDQIFTVKNGTTTFGDTTNRTGKIVITGGAKPQELYANAGEKVTLNYMEGADCSYKITTANTTASVDGSTLTMGSEDIEITATLKVVDKNTLREYYTEYSAKNSSYFKTSEGKDMATLLEETAAILGNDSITQSVVNDKVAEFKTVVYVGYPNVPDAKEIAEYPGAPGYRITDVEGFLTAEAHEEDYTLDQVLYLEDNLDLTGVTTEQFDGFTNTKVSFEGNNHTISNLNAGDGEIHALFGGRYYYGSFIKNLTLDNVHTRGGYARAALVSDYAGAGLTISNVHLNNCSVTITSTYGANAMGGLLGRLNTTAANGVTIENCTIIGTDFIGTEAQTTGNAGFIIGQMNKSTTYNVSNVLVKDCEITHGSEFATAYAFGCAEENAKVTVNNIVVVNNKKTNIKCENWVEGTVTKTPQASNRSDFIGVAKSCTITASNILVSNNTLPASSYADKTYAMVVESGGNVTLSNFYTDTDQVVRNAADPAGSFSKADIAAGAYAVNAATAADAYKWEIANGTIARDTDGAGLPAKVTFNVVTPDEASTVVETYELYTDVNGYVTNFASIADKADWEDEENIATTVYAEGDTVIGYAIPEHTHAWICSDPNTEEDTHTATCSMSWTNYGVTVVCGATETQSCVFDGNTVIVDANAEPEAASHTTTCACGNTTVVRCSEAGNWEVVTTPATCYLAGTTVYNCAACGYTHTDNIPKREHNFDAWTADDVAEGATQTHSRCCTHTDPACEGSTSVETEACTYSGDWVVVSKPGVQAGLQVKYCDKGCGSTLKQELPAIAAIDVNAETGYTGKDMNVDIEIHNHTGVAGLGLLVTYDSDVMTLNEAVKGALVGDVLSYIEVSDVSEADENGLVSVRIDAIWNKNVLAEGAVLTLNYSVDKEAASGEYTFNVEVLDAANYDGVTIFFGGIETTVDIESIVLGDIDGSGDVSIGDAVMMLRVACQDESVDYSLLNLNAADIVEEGNIGTQVINTNDVIMILRCIAGLLEL